MGGGEGGFPASKRRRKEGLLMEGTGCHHPKTSQAGNPTPALEHQREDRPPNPAHPIPGQNNGGSCLGSGQCQFR